MSTPVCPHHPESRVFLMQYMEGHLSWVCRTCGVDLPDVVEAVQSEVRIKVLDDELELAQTA